MKKVILKVYANDYYSDKGGEWSNYYHKQKLSSMQKIKLNFEN